MLGLKLFIFLLVYVLGLFVIAHEANDPTPDPGARTTDHAVSYVY